MLVKPRVWMSSAVTVDAVEIGGGGVLREDGGAGEQQAGEDGGGKRMARDRITLARHV